MTDAVRRHIGGEPQTYVSRDRPRAAPRSSRRQVRRADRAGVGRFSGRGRSHALQHDTRPGAAGLVHRRRSSKGWRRTAASTSRKRSSRGRPDEQARLPRRTLTEIGLRALRPFTRGEIDPATLEAVVVEALNFEIPLVEVEPGIFVLELFHGPTFAFKDVGARVMARLMASLDIAAASRWWSSPRPRATPAARSRTPSTACRNTRVVVLYPDGRVSPTQEAQLTMFNGERANVRAFAVAGSFDDCHRLTREAFGDAELRRRVRLTSANSVNVGRLLPQIGLLLSRGRAGTAANWRRVADRRRCRRSRTPSGNFGNLTAGLLAKRAGLPIARFVAATNANDVVPEYLDTGTFKPRPSVPTLANAMDVGHPSNFERMSWLYRGDVDAMRARHRRLPVHRRRCARDDPAGLRGARLPARSAQRDRVHGAQGAQNGRAGQAGIFLATAHPAKFGEIVEPIVGREIEKPAPLAQALARPRHIIRIEPSLAAVMANHRWVRRRRSSTAATCSSSCCGTASVRPSTLRRASCATSSAISTSTRSAACASAYLRRRFPEDRICRPASTRCGAATWSSRCTRASSSKLRARIRSEPP